MKVAVDTVCTSVGGKPQLLVELIREAANNDQIDDSLRKVNSAGSGREVVAEVAQGTAAVFRDRAWPASQACHALLAQGPATR